MTDNWYDTAQICTNGHVINTQCVYRPEHNKRFCDKCGASTITNCPKCNAIIRGYYHTAHVGTYDHTTLPLPGFCPDCSESYPWTEATLKAAKELSDEVDNLSPEERTLLKRSLEDIIRETPQTTVAATRFKRLVTKAGRSAVEAFRELLVDVLSETAKKIILEGK